MTRLLCVLLAALACHGAAAADGQTNHYRVHIDAGAHRAHVEADVWVGGNLLSVFAVTPTERWKNGQADFFEHIAVADMDGRPVAIENKGEGDFAVQGERRLRLRYDVRLDQDQYAWPGGAEEVAYHTDEGLAVTGYALFLVPGETMVGATEVSFALPPGWHAQTPWRAGADADSFIAADRRDLVNNVFFLGTAHAEAFRSGGIDLTLVMGKRYWPQRAVFRELIDKQLASYLEMFGAPPQAKRYLLLINQGGSGDGGAFSASFSQLLKDDGQLATRPLWGRVVAHELLHFWNGLSLTPASDQDEWFKEGVTDYLTVATMARNGLVGRDYLVEQLANLPRGQQVARRLMGLRPSVRDAAKDKHRNWLLVYGGGSVAALAMDVELRQAGSSLPALMRTLYAEFGLTHQAFTQDDVVRAARKLAGLDLQQVLEPIVARATPPDLAPLFARIGIQLEQYGMMETYLLRRPDDEAARQRFRDIFGMPF